MFKCPIHRIIPWHFDFDAACEWGLLAFAGSWRRQFRDVVVWFNGNAILSAQPAAQIDQFTPLAAKRKRRIWCDRIVSIGNRFFTDGAEHDAAFNRAYFADLPDLEAEDDACLGSGVGWACVAGLESLEGFDVSGFDAASVAELPLVAGSFAGDAAFASAFAADLYASLR